MAEPVTITKNGRDRLVLVSAEEYERSSIAIGGLFVPRS
ncbi:MAG: type II toxin-antitoxin system prevent-host-death family antitoxin [Acetobacteraceae bacterium]